jgi:hypothetical protein
MVGLYAAHELYTNPQAYGLTEAAAQNLKDQSTATQSGFLDALRSYELSPDHSHLYPDVVDGIFVTLADSFGYDVISRWYKMLQPPDAPWARLDGIHPETDYDGAKITSMTITACAFEVAARAELKELFETRWDFPIDDLLYAQVKPEIIQMIDGSTFVENVGGAPAAALRTLGNYPNPFNAGTMISFELPEVSPVHIQLYNTAGQLVRNDFVGELQPGTHNIAFEADRLSSGTYYYVVVTAFGRLRNKFVIVR